MTTKQRTTRIGYMAQCMSLDSSVVGRNLNFVPYSNEKAAQFHIEAHVAKVDCPYRHQVRSL